MSNFTPANKLPSSNFFIENHPRARFLQSNNGKGFWWCPVCDQKARTREALQKKTCTKARARPTA